MDDQKRRQMVMALTERLFSQCDPEQWMGHEYQPDPERIEAVLRCSFAGAEALVDAAGRYMTTGDPWASELKMAMEVRPKVDLSKLKV